MKPILFLTILLVGCSNTSEPRYEVDLFFSSTNGFTADVEADGKHWGTIGVGTPTGGAHGMTYYYKVPGSVVCVKAVMGPRGESQDYAYLRVTSGYVTGVIRTVGDTISVCN